MDLTSIIITIITVLIVQGLATFLKWQKNKEDFQIKDQESLNKIYKDLRTELSNKIEKLDIKINILQKENYHLRGEIIEIKQENFLLKKQLTELKVENKELEKQNEILRSRVSELEGKN